MASLLIQYRQCSVLYIETPAHISSLKKDTSREFSITPEKEVNFAIYLQLFWFSFQKQTKIPFIFILKLLRIWQIYMDVGWSWSMWAVSSKHVTVFGFDR